MKTIKLLCPDVFNLTSTTKVKGEPVYMGTEYFKLFIIKKGKNDFQMVDIFGNIAVFHSSNKEYAIEKCRKEFENKLKIENELSFYIDSLETTKKKIWNNSFYFESYGSKYMRRKINRAWKEIDRQLFYLTNLISYLENKSNPKEKSNR